MESREPERGISYLTYVYLTVCEGLYVNCFLSALSDISSLHLPQSQLSPTWVCVHDKLMVTWSLKL